jgi:DNA repair protein RadC
LEAGRRVRIGPEDLATVHSGEDVARLLEDMALLPQEQFRVLMLNARHRVLRVETPFVGGQSSVEVHPREVFRRAVEAGAAGIVAVHNHPSGDPTPSMEDRRLTHRLEDAGQVLGIPLLDHVIIGQGRYVSFRESGFMTATG